jgi:tRNA (guanine26-N2/guanine27-N2)-dimethyltransferase
LAREKLVVALEGQTKLLVPKASMDRAAPPTLPAFFNPAASINRDVSVAITEAVGGDTFCDSLAGVGARGLRIAKEVSPRMQVTLVDFNEEAVRIARRAALTNGVERQCEFFTQESRTFLYSRYGKGQKFDFVDVDPFGSPAPFLAAAVAAAKDGGIVSLTATDTAALCGVYPSVAYRRYGAVSLKSSFHHETGARILLNAIRRQAAAIERGILPIGAHSTRHYIRVFAAVRDGGASADEAAKGEGYVIQCRTCRNLERSTVPMDTCGVCGGKARWAGPLWVGDLSTGEVAGRAASTAERKGMRETRGILSALHQASGYPPWSYSIEEICSSLKLATVSEEKVREMLSRAGLSSTRQPFEKTGVKTEGTYSDVLEAVKRGAGR